MGAKRKEKEIRRKAFGQNPLEGFSYYNGEKRLLLIKRYHDARKEKQEENYIDETTWNDLEMNQVYLRINHTNSFIGEQYLFHLLHQTKDISTNAEFEKTLFYLEKEDLRVDVEYELGRIGKEEVGYYLFDFLIKPDLWKVGKTWIYHILQILLVLFLLGIILTNLQIMYVGLIVIGMTNLVIYLGAKQKFDVYFSALAQFKRIFDFGRWMERKHKEILSDEEIEAIHSLRRLSSWILEVSNRRQGAIIGDVMAILNDYLCGLLLVDVAAFHYMMKIIKNKQKEVFCLLELAGRMDTDISILSYRRSISYYCLPEQVEDKIKAKKLYHPLLKNPIPNDFILKDRAVISGSNASGKSTFMKSMAINCILAQTIHTCLAEQFQLPMVKVVSCMALRDDILSGESYYYREARCLKEMIVLSKEGGKLLIVIDEILKGTNTRERIAASKSILEYLGRTDSLILVATHDEELTCNQRYQNYHFSSRVVEEGITFDYHIQEGKADKSNAIALLEQLGYPREITGKAREYLNEN